MGKIESAQISLDDNVPEHMIDIVRLQSTEFFDENGETVHNASLTEILVDNSEFHSEVELVEHVAKIIGIDSSQIEVIR